MENDYYPAISFECLLQLWNATPAQRRDSTTARQALVKHGLAEHCEGGWFIITRKGVELLISEGLTPKEGKDEEHG